MGNLISVPGGTPVYIRQDGGDIQYSTDQISWINRSFPLTFTNSDTLSGILTVEFVTDISLNSADNYFICGSSHIQFGSTNLKLDGSRPVITIDGVSDPPYPGLIRNGTSENNGYSNIHVFNLAVNTSNASTLAIGGGWIGQEYFGKDASNNYIVNCNSDAPIPGAGGGIVGQIAGSEEGGSLTLIGCSSAGIIGNSAGGIAGSNAGLNSGSVTCESCWSEGLIGGSGGGIIGNYAINVTITNCYSNGYISGAGGGICGNHCEGAAITNCYSTGSRDNSYGSGGIVGSDSTNATISNCYSLGGAIFAFGSGGIIGGNASAYTITHCYTVGAVTESQGYIIGNSASIPDTCYSEDASGTAGTWSAVHTIGILLPGTIWTDTDLISPYELTAMGYTPYTRANIDISGGTPSLKRRASSSVIAGAPTAGAIIQGRSYTVLRIIGDSDSFSSIAMDPTTGVISTTDATAPGLYTIILRNNGSYNITEYDLTVTGEVATITGIPCCARPIFRRGPLIDNATLTSLTAGNTYIGSVRRNGTNISYAQIMAAKKANASK